MSCDDMHYVTRFAALRYHASAIAQIYLWLARLEPFLMWRCLHPSVPP